MSVDYAIRDEYVARFQSLASIAGKLQVYLRQTLLGIERIDAVTARAKDPDRFFVKATKNDEEGKPKYTNPRYQIQDQVGARITVFYLSDVEIVRETIVKNFRFIEEASKAPTFESEFGYFGLHFILGIPDDVIAVPEEDDAPEFFELQVKTLFQHAWSEAHHDMGYKSIRELTTDERRLMAFTAAQAWGADTIFNNLSKSLVTNDNEANGGLPQSLRH